MQPVEVERIIEFSQTEKTEIVTFEFSLSLDYKLCLCAAIYTKQQLPSSQIEGN